MKLIPMLAVAALMSAGAVVAATTPTTPTATPVPSATPAEKHTGMHCEKEAKEKNLTGEAEKKFVKECRDAKKPG